MPATGVAGSAQDELLRLTGAAGSPFQNLTTGTTNGTPVYYGASKVGQARLLIAGAVTGGGTLAANLVASSDAAGAVGAVTVASFPAQTASQYGGVGPAALDEPAVAFIMPPGKPYLRAQFVVSGGASPSFGAVGIMLDPVWGGTP